MKRLNIYAATTGTIAIAAAAFTLSYAALTELAATAGISTTLAWLWPLVVDGAILISTLAVVELRNNRTYAWTLLATGTLISLAGNAAHAVYDGPLPTLVKVGVASVPPLAIVASTHLTVLLVRNNTPEPSSGNTGPVTVDTVDVRQIAANLILNGDTITDAADKMGVSTRLVSNWSKDILDTVA